MLTMEFCLRLLEIKIKNSNCFGVTGVSYESE